MSQVCKLWRRAQPTALLLTWAWGFLLFGCAPPLPASDTVAYQCHLAVRATSRPMPGLLDLIDDQRTCEQCVAAVR